jgi:hypothetical protein
MTRIFAVFTLALLASCMADGQLAGKYKAQNSPYVDETLVLNSDGTFEYLKRLGMIRNSALGDWERKGKSLFIKSTYLPDNLPVRAWSVPITGNRRWLAVNLIQTLRWNYVDHPSSSYSDVFQGMWMELSADDSPCPRLGDNIFAIDQVGENAKLRLKLFIPPLSEDDRLVGYREMVASRAFDLPIGTDPVILDIALELEAFSKIVFERKRLEIRGKRILWDGVVFKKSKQTD